MLLPPLLLLILGIVWFRKHPPGGSQRTLGELAEVVDAGAPDALGGLEGLLDLAGGTRLFARLTPLQAAGSWQSFDAAALAARLELEGGTPWRLELLFERSEPLVEAVVEPVEPVALVPARVEDDAGRALRSIETSEPPSGGVADPLRTLLAQPAAELPLGTEVQLLLWGRAPGDAARLVLGAGERERTLELEHAEVPLRDLRRSLARLEAEDQDAEAR
ncbi:MAG: hypothetical protein AAF682_10955 [Planctomycetota bacterium]